MVEKKQYRFNLSARQYFSPTVKLENPPTPPLIGSCMPSMCLLYENRRWNKEWRNVVFPQNTNAFLYYTTSPKRPRISGELRLRVTSSNDPGSFESGSDLLRSDGLPWSRALHLVHASYPLLYQKLKEERLVPDDLDAALSVLPIHGFTRNHTHYLYLLTDPFIVEFGYNLIYNVITEQGFERLLMDVQFRDSRYKPNYWPYVGSVSVQFEPSTLPEHQGTRTVVLRFLEIIKLIECKVPLYDTYIVRPKAGELYQTIGPSGPQAWSVNIDEPHENSRLIRSLQLLWNAR